MDLFATGRELLYVRGFQWEDRWGQSEQGPCPAWTAVWVKSYTRGKEGLPTCCIQSGLGGLRGRGAWLPFICVGVLL